MRIFVQVKEQVARASNTFLRRKIAFLRSLRKQLFDWAFFSRLDDLAEKRNEQNFLSYARGCAALRKVCQLASNLCQPSRAHLTHTALHDKFERGSRKFSVA